MRGYFLIAIILNHLQYFPNGLDFLTMRGQLFVSSAEGFFLISGIVLGIVRGRKLIDKPLKVGASLLLKRAGQLYITYAILTILFTLIGWWFFMNNPGLKSGIVSPDTPFFSMVWNVLSFQYLYGWADYLRLYCLFMLVSPVVLWLLRHGKWWVALLGSIIVWLAVPELDWPQSVYTQPFNWQLLFFSGMIIGFHWQEIAGFWKKIPILWRKIGTATLVTTSLVTLAVNLYLSFGGELGQAVYDVVAPLREELQYAYFNKENLQWPRVLMFFAWFWSSFWFFTKFEKQITKFFGWLLLSFGTNSLYVYTVHAFLIFFAHLLIAPGSTNFFTNVPLTFIVIAIIWVMIRYKVLFKIIPR